MEKHIEILIERFSKDSLMALATVDAKGIPWVRTIDAILYFVYEVKQEKVLPL